MGEPPGNLFDPDRLRADSLAKCGLSKGAFIRTGPVCASAVDAVRLAIYFASVLSGSDLGFRQISSPGLLAARTFAAFLGSFLGSRLLRKVTMKANKRLVGALLFMLVAGKLITGNAADLLDVATSMEFNFATYGSAAFLTDSPATDLDYTPNSAFPDWVFEMTYEVQISGSAFGPSGFGGISIPLVHDSPNKVGKNMVFPITSGPVIPEPSTLILLAGGLIFLGFLGAWKLAS